MTEVREPVWTYLRRHCNAVFSDIFTLNTVGVMTQELKSLFLVQKSNQSVFSSCNNAISNKTSCIVYITSLNLLQNKFEDSISAVILRKRSRRNCNFCKGHFGDVSMLQQFICLQSFYW